MKNILDKVKGLFSSLKSRPSLQKALEKVQSSFPSNSSSQSLSDRLISMKKPPLERFYPQILTILIAYFSAELITTYMRVYTIPSDIPRAQVAKTSVGGQQRLRAEYSPITQRNIFNSDGIIPDPISSGEREQEEVDGPAVPSNLPLNLVGTIVHINPAKSVATIEVRPANKIIPYIPNDPIDNLATLLRVERRKAYIRNRQNNRLEYIEMKDDVKLRFGLSARPQAPASGGGDIVQDGSNFSVSRSFLDEQLSNMGDVLQQARAVPNRDPITGEINGFRMLYIRPDSVFTKIGLRPGDLLQNVNGTQIDSIQKAMEMYQSMRGASTINLQIEREGRREELNYTVTE